MNQAVKVAQELPAASVAASDRLSFTLFLAAVIHAVFILGVGFTLPKPQGASQTIEITLATHQTLKAPDDADFLAQHNQTGSGTLDDSAQLTTTQIADFADLKVREVTPVAQQQAAQESQELSQQIITTTARSNHQVFAPDQQVDQEVLEQQEGLLEDQPFYDTEIASLQAKLDLQRQEYARRPRERVLTSVSTRAAYDAKYLHDWTVKVEQIGTEHYPREALLRRITGKLRMSVLLNPDGSIVQITVLQSSGQRVLDDAAKQIVRLAAPFAAFPNEMRQHTDRLQIIRTWSFEISGQNSTITTSAN